MNQPNEHDLARQIVDHNLAGRDISTPAAAAAAAEIVFQRLADNLVRWVGADGSQALFTRARSLAQAENASLRDVPPPARSALFLDGLAAGTEPHDAGAIIDAAVTILGKLIELLGRLVGDDLAMRLLTDTVLGQEVNGEQASSRERKS